MRTEKRIISLKITDHHDRKFQLRCFSDCSCYLQWKTTATECNDGDC
ncbi:hypothetical protein [Ehrlichia ruminantium]|nr:hypothetical protein [Ehrlichia ruminantium]UOD99797.1 hypothetical protein IMW62_00610 [Ehrlichia ruminantium]